MQNLAILGEGACIAELGLSQALKYVAEQCQACGEDLGITYVEAWCHSQWRRLQRRCRVEHVFGKRQYCQFPAWQFGLWSEHDREVNFEFDLVVGKYESGAENLDFVFWTNLQKVSEEARRHFEILDPNWPRFGNEIILQMAKKALPLTKRPATNSPASTPPGNTTIATTVASTITPTIASV